VLMRFFGLVFGFSSLSSALVSLRFSFSYLMSTKSAPALLMIY
jgi:hypothetical protein